MLFRKYRELRGYTQEKLSEITGIDNRTIQRIENEEHLPNIVTFSKLIFALDISREDILDYLESLSSLKNIHKQQ